MFKRASRHAVGVLLITPVTASKAVLCTRTKGHILACTMVEVHHETDPYVMVGRTMALYIHKTTLGLRPQAGPIAFLHTAKDIIAFFALSSQCCFQLSLLSIVTPRYFAWVLNGISVPFSCKGEGRFLRLVLKSKIAILSSAKPRSTSFAQRSAKIIQL